MAQKQTVTYVSDLSGAEITDNDSPSLRFGWDGTDYTIDLTAKEAEKFYKAVEPYLTAATKVGRSGGRSRGKASSSGSTSNAAEIRAWAKSNGMEVPERGRIPAEVREAFESKAS